jgi:hypothetical protein
MVAWLNGVDSLATTDGDELKPKPKLNPKPEMGWVLLQLLTVMNSKLYLNSEPEP